VKAVLRVDGGRAIGMGHLVRTRALARALAERGVPPLFATASEEGERWLRARGEDVVRIDAEPGASQDAIAVTRLAQEHGACRIVTDGYAFREEYLQTLVETCLPVASIDDLAAWSFPSAFVINGGLGSRKLRYHTAPDTRLLVGPEYLLLRPEFARPPTDVRSAVQRMFVCFGGADPEDRTGQTVEAWSRLEAPPALEVLVGAAYPHLERLRRRAARGRTGIHSDLEGHVVAKLMGACDLAIASAGMVACELAALGVPLVLVVTSEDQRSNALALVEAGAAVLAEPPTGEGLVEAAQRLMADPEQRGELSHRAGGLVDSQGASRVSAAMMRGA
jgi:UDP-2,4-diacetamido-2,4,6-trideoxy-beta-L-altropyranose hydrolase